MYSLIFILFSIFQTSIYSLHFNNIDGEQVNMQTFSGKKILLVNIATGSKRVDQLSGLQQLHNLYGDSLVIIAFPSNSFNNEAKSNAEIKQFCQSNYGISFLLAQKDNVSGTGIQSIYNWLANKSENGDTDAVTGGDFQKFLIEKDGSLLGVFSPAIDPMDGSIQNALTGN